MRRNFEILTVVTFGAVAGIAFLLSSCSEPIDEPVNDPVAFDVMFTGDGDGCGIAGWTIATQPARLLVMGSESELTVEVIPDGGGSVLVDLVTSGLLTGSGVASDFAVEALSDSAVGPCDSQYRLLMSGVEDVGTLLGTVSYVPVSDCGELAGCSADQVFSGTRSD